MNYITVEDRTIDKASLIPDMARCLKVESRNANAIVFFQQGEFYEVYGHSAKVVASHLRLALSSKAATRDEDRVWMCAVDGDMVEAYAEELGKMGYPIAICQMEKVKDRHRCYVRSWLLID